MRRSTAFRPALGTRSRCARRSCAISIGTGATPNAPNAEISAMTAIAVIAPRPKSRYLLDRPELVGPLFIAPAILYVFVLVALPFFLAIYYSVSAFTIFDPSYRFVGLKNFIDVIDSDIFRRTLINTFVFTIGAQIIGLLLGKFAAWLWMFDSLYSVINWTLVAIGLMDPAHRWQWLGQQDLAMIAVTVVHAWRLFPFGVVIFIAGFTSVPKDVLDAATVDGAGFWRRNYQIILPIIAPIVVIAVIFGTVFTFTDLSVVYLLTKGGPINGTHVLGSLAFQVGILSGDVAHGAAICLFLF